MRRKQFSSNGRAVVRDTYGGILRMPFHHTFSNKLVIIDGEEFKSQYPTIESKYKLKYGNVLDVLGMRCVQEEVYSKKKKRNVKKMKVDMYCNLLKDTKTQKSPKELIYNQYSWSSYRNNFQFTVKYDSSIFVQAKWKRIDR